MHNYEELKQTLEGECIIERLNYRNQILPSKEAVDTIAKDVDVQTRFAHRLSKTNRNPRFGFVCLHHTIMEDTKIISVRIENKLKKAGPIGVRTVEGDAKEHQDYHKVDKVIEFHEEE